MAYMNQERKKRLAALVKEALKGVDLKYSLAVKHHSAIVMNIREGSIDFFGDFIADKTHIAGRRYLDVNPYWYQEHFTGKSLAILRKIFAALNNGNHDRSDIQSDYFDVGWYVDVNIGTYDAPYIFRG